MSDVERAKAKAKLAELIAKGNARAAAEQRGEDECDLCGPDHTIEGHIVKAHRRAIERNLGTDDPSAILKAIGAAQEPPPLTRTAATLKAARLAKRMTQVELAKAVGCSQPAISAIEKGAAPVSGILLRSVCRELGVDPLSL